METEVTKPSESSGLYGYIFILIVFTIVGLSTYLIVTFAQPRQSIVQSTPITLTKTAVVKSFHYDMLENNENRSNYFSHQIDAYLNSITNLKDYTVTTTKISENNIIINLNQK